MDFWVVHQMLPWITPSQEINVENPENENIDFEAGIEVGREEQLTELEDQLVDQGYDPEEVDELLYDPAPRRRGRKKGKKSRSHKRTYDPSPRRRFRRSRRYDPAPKNGYRKKAKGILGKLKPFVGVGVGGLTFYGAYTKRTADLKAAGSLPATANIFDAVMYDINHFNGNDAMARVQTKAAGIATPAIAGWAIKKFVSGTAGKLIGDALMGFAGGTAAKTILDPPIATQPRAPQISRTDLHVPEPQQNHNPYLNGGY